jgi:hypothetical protein
LIWSCLCLAAGAAFFISDSWPKRSNLQGFKNLEGFVLNYGRDQNTNKISFCKLIQYPAIHLYLSKNQFP